MSYHGIYITTVDMPRTSLFDMPYGYELVISRVCGCVLYYRQGTRDEEPRVVASEFPLSDKGGIKVEYGKEVLCNSLPDALYEALESRLAKAHLPDHQEIARIHRYGVTPKIVEVEIPNVDRVIERHFDPGSGDIAIPFRVSEGEHIANAVAALEG